MTDTNQLPPLPPPQPAQATQAEVTDGLLHPEDFNVEVVMKQMGGFVPVSTQGVRVTHKPTGISVTCDAARSQHTNRHHAFEQLRAILALRPAAVPMTCHCQTCRPITITDMRMVLCPKCGNKRCPHANDHRNACTGSNEPGQPGSAYPDRHSITTQAKKEGA